MARQQRGRGEGSIFFYKPRKCWCGSITVGIDANGRRRRRVIYGRTKSEVQEKIAQAQVDAGHGLLIAPARIRVAQFLERWLDTIRPQVRLSTILWYEALARNHISPRLGGLQLKNIGPIHVQTLLSELEREGAGARTRQAAYTLLNQAFKQAIRWDLIRRNACDGVDRPRVTRTKIRALDPEEARQLIAAANGDRLEALYVLALTTGLRQGELLALRWSDIDLDRAALAVQRSLAELNGEPVRGGSFGRYLIDIITPYRTLL